MSTSHQSATRQAPNTFGFLQLPGELRNRIYTYLLTSPDETLHYPSPEDGSQPSNQLQYVCKQLHRECHWLELKFNPTLKFKSATNIEPTAAQSFLGFLNVIPENMRTAIKVVELYSGGLTELELDEQFGSDNQIEDTKFTLFHLADVCRYNSNLTVKYRIRVFDTAVLPKIERPCIVYLGACHAYSLRNEIHDEIWSDAMDQATKNNLLGHLSDWAGYDIDARGPRQTDVTRLGAANLRFFPMDGVLEDVSFDKLGSFFSPAGQDLMPIWERLMKKWATEGF